MPIGPSTATGPYLIGTAPNVRLTSIVTVGDPLPDDGPFVGIPDGIGAFDNGDGTITVLVNHELRADAGSVRDHGFTGAFVDRLVIDKQTLAIVSSDDLIKSVLVWNAASDGYEAASTPIGRLCSADLPEASAFYNASSGLGSSARIYLTGEEVGAEGRLFGTVVSDNNGPDETGTAYELPFLGNMSYENAVANPYAQNKTIVAVTDDSRPGQVYIYVGEKRGSGTEIEKAGLHGGDLYGVKVTDLPNELAETGAAGTFTLQEMGNRGDVSELGGAELQAESTAEGVTEFLRPEDAAWDPDQPNVLYFVTTGNPTTGQPSRLYKLTFDDITDPVAGGNIEMLVEGIGGPGEVKMLDNMTVENGKIVMQEDPGSDPRQAKVWEYDIASGGLTELAQFDPALFGGDGPVTIDEESSGVIDVTDVLGDADTRAYLLDAQVHAPSGDPATVELGQLAVMYVDEAAAQGTNRSDRLEGNGSAQTFRALNGNDVVLAWGGNDVVFGGNGNDQLDGHTGDDQLSGERGDDLLAGGFGEDVLSGGAGSDRLIGGGDRDTLIGGDGGDLFIFDNRGETGDDLITDFGRGDRLLTTVQLGAADGNGLVPFGATLGLFGTSAVDINAVGGADVNGLRYAGTVTVDGVSYFSYASGGTAADDSLESLAGADVVDGGLGIDTVDYQASNARVLVDLALETAQREGHAEGDILVSVENVIGSKYGDRLDGNDESNTLDGFHASDVLNGRGGADVLTGGTGNDRFVFASAAEANGDRVTDFSVGFDKLDFRPIDSDGNLPSDQKFTWLDTAAFTGKAGQLREYDQDGKHFVAGDINGDGSADFTIEVAGTTDLASTDILF